MEDNKNILAQFEVDNLENKADELSNIDDLWYFIKSSQGSWVAGSTK